MRVCSGCGQRLPAGYSDCVGDMRHPATPQTRRSLLAVWTADRNARDDWRWRGARRILDWWCDKWDRVESHLWRWAHHRTPTGEVIGDSPIRWRLRVWAVVVWAMEKLTPRDY
jgi:hypothetical protein